MNLSDRKALRPYFNYSDRHYDLGQARGLSPLFSSLYNFLTEVVLATKKSIPIF